MGGAAGAKYSDCTAAINSIVLDGLDLHVDSQLSFRLVSGATTNEVCGMIAARGKQMGILIGVHQRIEGIEFKNGSDWVPYVSNPHVSRNCAVGFGETVGLQWVGFSLAPGRTITPDELGPDRMGYGLRFTLRNFRTRFQVIPIVHACLDLNIVEFNVVSVHVIRIGKPRIVTSVDSTIDYRQA
jgi:hypothetical protein